MTGAFDDDILVESTSPLDLAGSEVLVLDGVGVGVGVDDGERDVDASGRTKLNCGPTFAYLFSIDANAKLGTASQQTLESTYVSEQKRSEEAESEARHVQHAIGKHKSDLARRRLLSSHRKCAPESARKWHTEI